MNAELMDLGRRAVACKGWRWMPGMLVGFDRKGRHSPIRIIHSGGEPPWEFIDEGERHLACIDGVWHCDGEEVEPPVPNLSDPATLGCLLELVRVAHNSPISASFVGDSSLHKGNEWHAWSMGRSHYGDTEAEALVAALEAEP